MEDLFAIRCAVKDGKPITEHEAKILDKAFEVTEAELKEWKQRTRGALLTYRRDAHKSREAFWVSAMRLFGYGSTRACQLCRDIMLDPESRKSY
jgi:hypothetical protein